MMILHVENRHWSGLLTGRPTSVLRILWAFSLANPLWSAKSRGPLAGPAHYGPQNLVGLYLGWPIMARKNLVGLYLGRPIMAHKILWAFSWAVPLLAAKSCGPLVGPAHLNFMGHFWAGPRVNIS